MATLTPPSQRSTRTFPDYSPLPGVPSKTDLLCKDSIKNTMEPNVNPLSNLSRHALPTAHFSSTPARAGSHRGTSNLHAPVIPFNANELSTNGRGSAASSDAVAHVGNITTPSCDSEGEQQHFDGRRRKIYSCREAGLVASSLPLTFISGYGNEDAFSLPTSSSTAAVAFALPDKERMDGESKMAKVLQGFENECHELLFLLSNRSDNGEFVEQTLSRTQQKHMLQRSRSSDFACTLPDRDRTNFSGSPINHDSSEGCMASPVLTAAAKEIAGVATAAGTVSPLPQAAMDSSIADHLALKWTAFLLRCRLQQLQSVEQCYKAGGADGPLHLSSLASTCCDTALQESCPAALHAGLEAQHCLQKLERLLRVTTQCPSPNDTREEQAFLCTFISNQLSLMATKDDNTMARLLNDVAAGRASLSGRSALKGEAGIVAHAFKDSTADAAPGDRLAHLDDPEVLTQLLQSTRTTNTLLQGELQEMARKAEKARRHLKRERAQKEDFARRYAAVVADNAGLLQRFSYLEGMTASEKTVGQALGAKGNLTPMGQGSSAMAGDGDAKSTEYAHLEMQLSRQTNNIKELRSELLISKQENQKLYNTVAQLQGFLEQHHAAWDMVTRPKGSEASCTSQEEKNAVGPPSTALLRQILTGKVKLTIVEG